MGPATVDQDSRARWQRGFGASEKTNIRYFCVKDRVDAGELNIQYMPTEDLVADFFIKPRLQVELFHKLRASVMGLLAEG